ncbi:MAG TPA: hypothetical protein VN694_09505 [Caulobacteraceae bacterium]|nr:hypothetical protein [Caulobacteraceae bacterium]
MRLDRLLPLPTPVHQPGHKDDRPPRRQPEPPEPSARRDAPDPTPDDHSGGDRPTPPDHLDITV